MNSASPGPRVKRETVEETALRLRTFIGRMEHRYEMSSAEMEAGVTAGSIRETAELSRWMSAMAFLRDLIVHGGTTGTPTSSTR